MATSQISDVRQALKTILADAGHTAFAYAPGDTVTASPKEYAFLDSVSSDQEHHAFGGSREENLSVSGVVFVSKAGATDAVAKSAEDAALAVVSDLEDGLRADPGLSDGDVFHAEFAGIDSSEVLADGGNRVCVLRFTVDVEAHI